MAALGKETGSVVDRSFGANGLMGRFKAWVVKTYSNHGPAWTIYRDKSTDAVDPYIVVTNQSSPTENSKAIFLKVGLVSATERILITYYLGWNSSTDVGVGPWGDRQLTTLTGTFSYYFRGGPTLLSIITRIGGSSYQMRVAQFNGIWDAVRSKGLEPESASGVLTAAAFLETDPGGYLSGYQNMTGVTANLDAAGNLYFSLVNTTGTTFQINIYKDSARTLLIGHSGIFTNTTTGARGIIADNSSGLGGTITNDITVLAVTNIECRFNRLTLGTGEGATFTVNRWYFGIDLTGNVLKVRYFKVTAISGDVLTVDGMGNQALGVGAYVSPFPHRWIGAGGASDLSGNFSNSPVIPYSSNPGSEIPGFSNNNNFTYDWMQNTMQRVNPDDEGGFPCMHPWIVEASGNRLYGEDPSIVYTGTGGLAAFTDRRELDSVHYLAVATINSGFMCIIDDEALS